jgi:hypothetical protein
MPTLISYMRLDEHGWINSSLADTHIWHSKHTNISEMNSIPETVCWNHQMWLTRLGRFYWILFSWQLQDTEPDWKFSYFSATTLWKNANITSSNVPLKLTLITNHIIIPYLIQHYIQQFTQCHKTTNYTMDLGWDPISLSCPAPVWNLILNPVIQPAAVTISTELSWLTTYNP